MSQRAVRSFNVLKTWGLAFLVAAGTAHAASVTVTPKVAPIPEAPPIAVKDGAVLLSVDEAVEIALQRNLNLVVQRYVRDRVSLGILQALGFYDLNLNGQLSATDQASATASALQSGQSSSQTLNVGLAQAIVTGGVFSFGFNNTRSKNNSSFSVVNPAYNSGIDFTFDQPLLRNFGRFATEYNLLVAQNNSAQSRQQFELQVITTIQNVIDAYWNLVGARSQLVVAQESLALAKELHSRNRIQVEVGTLAPLELVSSEANIATNEENIITAQAAVTNAEDALRQLLNLPPGELWQAEIRPTTDPVSDRVQVNVEESIQSALGSRAELKTQQLAIQQAQLSQKFFRNQLKPSLDLRLDYNATGTGGNVVVRDPNTGQIIRTIPGGYGDAFSQVRGFDFTGWSARLLFNYPLQNRAARAQAAGADIDVERTGATLDQLRLAIITEVRAAARRVDTAAKSIDAARISQQFQEKNLEAEKKKYENGLSTSFQITRIQQDVTLARSNQVTAIINYRIAVADYYRATGRLLDIEGVRIDDPEDPVQRMRFGLFR